MKNSVVIHFWIAFFLVLFLTLGTSIYQYLIYDTLGLTPKIVLVDPPKAPPEEAPPETVPSEKFNQLVALIESEYNRPEHQSKMIVANVFKYAAARDLDPALVFAVIAHESGFNPKVVNSGGDHGLMQINRKAWAALFDAYGTREMLSIPTNIKEGTGILKSCVNRNETLYKSLRCYNGWGSQSIGYPPKVMAHLKHFKSILS